MWWLRIILAWEFIQVVYKKLISGTLDITEPPHGHRSLRCHKTQNKIIVVVNGKLHLKLD